MLCTFPSWLAELVRNRYCRSTASLLKAWLSTDENMKAWEKGFLIDRDKSGVLLMGGALIRCIYMNERYGGLVE